MTENLAFKWTVILACVAVALWIFIAHLPQPISLGIDLKGGTSLTYAVSKASLHDMPVAERSKTLDDTIATISKRIDTLGMKELTVRRVGDTQIEIDAPNMGDAELQAIQEQMLSLGNLEFLIGFKSDQSFPKMMDVRFDNSGAFEKYPFDKKTADAQRREAFDAGKTKKGDPYHILEPYVLVEQRGDHWVPLPFKWLPEHVTDKDPAAADFKKARDPATEKKDINFDAIRGEWLYSDPQFFGPGLQGFTGKDIKDPKRSADQFGKRTVVYTVEKHRQDDFYEYTSKYVNEPMAICLNDEAWSSPIIHEALRDSVQIRGGGNGFDEQSQSLLVNCLTSGSLRLKPRLVSTANIGPSLGDAAIKRGLIATALSFFLVIAFMYWYYRFAGITANVALLLNVVFTMAVVSFFRATLTLPGIAGVILTIGMAVDANILVFERTREEYAKGKGLLAALQAGYDRAFVTIFDSHVTTALTAALLIEFGSGPIKGFGVTLLAGIVMSLFTALYVTKAILGLWVKKGWLTKIHFIEVIKNAVHYPFVEKSRPWITGSALLSIIGLVLFATTGDKKYGLDFTGGTVATVRFAQPIDGGEIKTKMENFAVNGRKRYLEVDVQPKVRLDGQPRAISTKFDIKAASIADVSGADVQAFLSSNLSRLFPPGPEAAVVQDTKPATPIPNAPGEWTVEFAFDKPVPVTETLQKIDQYRDEDGNQPFLGAQIEPADLNTNADDAVVAQTYRIGVSRQDISRGSAVRDIKTLFADRLDPKEPFEGLNYLGPNVVANLKESAIVSIIFSIAAIALYIWFRFKEARYGIAACICLVHDVLVPLGLSISMHLLGIINVPLNLQSIAAFLTIVGWSINDTIVVFDRVRENVHTMSGSYRDIVNTSIGQTLSRTILTSLTVFTVVLVLFVCNIGNDSPLEGLGFTLVIGTIAGTYSTIFIACPYVVWKHEREERLRREREKASASGTLVPAR